MNDSNGNIEAVDLSPTRAELIARVRSRGRQIRARRRLGIASLTALVVIGVAAPAIAIGTRSESKSVPPATVSTTRPPSPQPDITVRIELPSTTLVAGSTMKGRLVVDNATNRDINLAPSPTGCWPHWAVTLRNSELLNEPGFYSDCKTGQWLVAPGENWWPFTLVGSHYSCAAGQLRVCPPGLDSLDSTPPLPLGEYHAVLVSDSPGFVLTPPPVPVRVVAAAAATDLGTLSLQSGARSTKMLVPAGWTLKIEDGGGSGSGSTWTNPDDPKEQIIGVTGGEVGAWWETDGVKGSITPLIAAPGTQVQRVNYTTFLFHSDPPDGYPIDGVWLALVDARGPLAFVSASVQLPSALHATATTILNRFISYTNARVPPFPGPPNP